MGGMNTKSARELRKNLADVKEKYLSTGVEAVGSSPAALAAKMKSDMTIMGKVIRDAGVKAD